MSLSRSMQNYLVGRFLTNGLDKADPDARQTPDRRRNGSVESMSTPDLRAYREDLKARMDNARAAEKKRLARALASAATELRARGRK